MWQTIGEVSTNNMKNVEYAFTLQNTLTEWGVLLGMALLYAVIGLIFLENIDKDKR